MPPKEINTEPCRVCGVVIRYKGDVPRHEQLHRPNDAVTMYKCPYQGCEYQNLQKSNLNTHIYTHTGEKPRACPDCDYRTADPGSLTRHRKKKHGYVPDCQRLKAKPIVSTRQPGNEKTYTRKEVLLPFSAPLDNSAYSGDISAALAYSCSDAYGSSYDRSTHDLFSYTWDKDLFHPGASHASNPESSRPSLPHSTGLFLETDTSLQFDWSSFPMQAPETGTIRSADLSQDPSSHGVFKNSTRNLKFS